MKLLIISDIHSNIWALNRILETETGIDLVCCAGDLTDYGIAPVEVIDRMRSLPSAIIVSGNHDINTARVFRENKYHQVKSDQFKWVHHNCQRLTDDHIEYLENLPAQAVFEADGYTYLISHQYDEGYGTIQNMHQFETFWSQHVPASQQAANRRIIFGHTHRQCIHTLDEKMVWLNPGSASYRRPDDPDKRAHYMVIEDGEIRLCRIAYDRSALLAEAQELDRKHGMMEKELEVFYFFFGPAKEN